MSTLAILNYPPVFESNLAETLRVFFRVPGNLSAMDDCRAALWRLNDQPKGLTSEERGWVRSMLARFSDN